ncbi:MAG: hypothetical protein HY815_04140 [Candidatus Riflebacteria bacterium]|nr:hypothetical protein [Candidatus Riflebacteria bacterium]
MSDRPVCRECVQGSKVGKDKKPVRPGMIYCAQHRKPVTTNYTCGQFKKRSGGD